MNFNGYKTSGTLLLSLFFSAIPLQVVAQQASFRLSGYAKNLGIRSSSFFTNESFYLDVSRLRTKSIFDFGSKNRTELWLDSEIVFGNLLVEFRALETSFGRPKFADLDWSIKEGDKYQLRQSLFRAFSTFYLGNSELTIGRQRIAWGTGFVWNPTDLLNPFNPAAIELGEKQGVDAVYLVLPLGTLSRFEAVFAPGRKKLNPSAAARMTGNLGEYDFSIMAGEFEKDRVLGGDFAGYIGGAGFRGEFAYTWKDTSSNFFRAILNVDYNFPNDLYAFVELHYNGQGATNKERYPFLINDLLSGKILSLARHYAAVSVIKTVTPLLGLNIYTLFNLNDRSSLIGPALTYSLTSNLEIAASTYLLSGASDSEFGAQDNIYFAYLQYYF